MIYDQLFDRAQEQRPVSGGVGCQADHAGRMLALIHPAQPVAAGAALPYHMVVGNPLAVDVPAGTVITAEMIRKSTSSTLWSLRAQQDQLFHPAPGEVGHP